MAGSISPSLNAKKIKNYAENAQISHDPTLQIICPNFLKTDGVSKINKWIVESVHQWLNKLGQVQQDTFLLFFATARVFVFNHL